ncbi:unnamed protein product, partial [Protopolystoma xenopodis]
MTSGLKRQEVLPCGPEGVSSQPLEREDFCLTKMVASTVSPLSLLRRSTHPPGRPALCVSVDVGRHLKYVFAVQDETTILLLCILFYIPGSRRQTREYLPEGRLIVPAIGPESVSVGVSHGSKSVGRLGLRTFCTRDEGKTALLATSLVVATEEAALPRYSDIFAVATPRDTC